MNFKDLGLILIQGIVIYLFISTLAMDASFVGSLGHWVGQVSRDVFGLLSFVMYIVLFYIFYRLYRVHQWIFRNFEVAVASLLLFFTLLIVQALVLPDSISGSFGESFIAFMQPFIGLIGVWVFWMMTTLIAVIIMKDISLGELLMMLNLRHNKPFDKAPEDETNHTVISEPFEPLEEESPSNERTMHEEIDGADSIQRVANVTLEDKLNNILPEDDETQFEIKKVTLHEEKVSPQGSEENSTHTVVTQPLSELSQASVETVAHEAPMPSTIDSSQTLSTENHHALIVSELEENTKLLDEIEQGEVDKPKGFNLPPLSILASPKQKMSFDEGHLDAKIADLIQKLNKFKIEGDVIRTYTGPVVSTFEFKPAAHIKVSKILSLQDDLAMALKAKTIRIQAPIPGKDVVGIEIPNETVNTIYLRDILESELFQNASSPLTIALGEDIVGKPFITDLKKLPHLLIAGTTGSGKSVGINAMILSLLYRNSPDQLRFIMIDPKMLEFSIYNDIPHLLTPVITKPKQAITALNNMVSEMERRYALMSESKTKNIDTYNEKMQRMGKDKLPYIVVIIDELADLMMTSGKEVEYSIGRLAQMARASGIHLIVATQRPSVDVVTGLIKANLPSRISYRVGQKIDSKVILDSMGAESLLGRGDMLFTPPGATGLVRLHAPWSSEEEIEEIVEFVKSQKAVEYDQRFLSASNGDENADIALNEELDPLYDEAKAIVLSEKKTSISYLQRRLQIGYNKAARIIEQLEAMGVLSEPNTKGVREIL